MQDSSKPAAIDPKRRRFLRAAGGAGALATLASVAGEGGAAPVAAAQVAAPAEPKAAGYRETAHILAYYRSAAYW